MNHFQARRCGFSAQWSANTTAKKIAKSVVGKSMQLSFLHVRDGVGSPYRRLERPWGFSQPLG
jgi:hypothetical protein